MFWLFIPFPGICKQLIFFSLCKTALWNRRQNNGKKLKCLLKKSGNRSKKTDRLPETSGSGPESFINSPVVRWFCQIGARGFGNQ
jgi:hypothetical protein